jgi:hypothetical protein
VKKFPLILPITPARRVSVLTCLRSASTMFSTRTVRSVNMGRCDSHQTPVPTHASTAMAMRPLALALRVRTSCHMVQPCPLFNLRRADCKISTHKSS